MKKKILIISGIIILIDQISKYFISSILNTKESIIIVKHFFYLTYLHNRGAAWSLFDGMTVLLIFCGIFATYIVYSYINEFKENKRNNLAFGLLLGGIIGNLIDRIIFGFVRDFLDFKIFSYDFPIFNIADVAIVIGVCLLIYAIIKGEDYGSSSKRKESYR